jgi:hypothetical protein
MHIELAADERFPGHGNDCISLDEIDAAGSVGDEWLSAYLPNKRIASVGIGSVKRRYSRTVGAKYLSNGCVHCDALQGAFFDHEIAWEAKPVDRLCSNRAVDRQHRDRWPVCSPLAV